MGIYQHVIVHHGEAWVAGVPYAIFVAVSLFGVGVERAVVFISAKPVEVGIIIGIFYAGIAAIAHPIAVGIFRATIAGVAHAICVGISLVGVGYARAVIVAADGRATHARVVPHDPREVAIV